VNTNKLIPALSARSIFYLVVAIGLTVGATTIGALLTDISMPWYGAMLKKPWFNPPNLAFPIAWTTLYTFMAFSFWRILRTPVEAKGRGQAIIAFLVQLGFNVLWSFLFFYKQDPATALLEIMCLLTAIIFMIVSFRPVDRLSYYLMWPYAAWVSFATLLNLAIVILNPDMQTLWNRL
jgi:translocator protein